MKRNPISLFFFFFLFFFSSSAFESDELELDDDEFVSTGSKSSPDLEYLAPVTRSPTRKRSSSLDHESSDSKVQFSLDHAFGDSDFSPAGTFSARLKTWSHGGQTLTKLRFSRNTFMETEKKEFEKLLKDDEFYMIRVPSNVLNPLGKDYIISSVKAVLLIDALTKNCCLALSSVD